MIRTYTPVLTDKSGNVRYVSVLNARKEIATSFVKKWAKERIELIRDKPGLFDADAITPMLIDNRRHKLIAI